jgi:hypothetical protein
MVFTLGKGLSDAMGGLIKRQFARLNSQDKGTQKIGDAVSAIIAARQPFINAALTMPTSYSAGKLTAALNFNVLIQPFGDFDVHEPTLKQRRSDHVSQNCTTKISGYYHVLSTNKEHADPDFFARQSIPCTIRPSLLRPKDKSATTQQSLKGTLTSKKMCFFSTLPTLIKGSSRSKKDARGVDPQNYQVHVREFSCVCPFCLGDYYYYYHHYFIITIVIIIVISYY